MKPGNRIFSAFLFAVIVAIVPLVSCVSDPEPVAVVDYSDERRILYEIDKTRLMLDSNSLDALLHAVLLLNNSKQMDEITTLYADARDRAAKEFRTAVEAEQWTDALRLWRSLDTLSLTPQDWNEESLIAKRKEAWRTEGNKPLINLGSATRSYPGSNAPGEAVVARMIKGTVTVWVDRGLRVEQRVGYADRVIGSGFFIDDRGYLITNYHVIASEVDPKYEGYSRLFIKLADDSDTRIPARVIGWDPVFDLALLKTEITPPEVFSLGSSRDLSVGNRIYAIGSPAGLEQTLTSGIVSAQRRRILSLGDILQIDAPINHGNSGGPIVDENGLVQAVVFAGIEAFEGLNFAIPVELLKIILPGLYEGGKIEHAWMGAVGRTGSLTNAPKNEGVQVVYTIPGSPLSVSGVPENALITAMNGSTVRTLEELQNRIIREEAGTIVKISGRVENDGKEEAHDWFVLLEERPEKPADLAFTRDVGFRVMLPLFGMNLEPVGSKDRYTVSSLIRGSIADESGFSEQDSVEIRKIAFNDDRTIVSVQFLTKRRKSGYMDAFIGLASSLDSPSYF